MISTIKKKISPRCAHHFFFIMGVGGLFLSACTETEFVVPGERIAVLADVNRLNFDSKNPPPPPILGEPIVNRSAFHVGLSSGHAGGHLSLSLPLKTAWRASVARPDSPVITLPQPIITADTVIALGADARLTAFDLDSGKVKWHSQIDDKEAGLFPGKAGGIAANAQVIAVHAARKKLSIVHSQTGDLIWSATHETPLAGGPTLSENFVFVNDLDGYVFVYDLEDGALVWQTVGLPVDTVVFGSAAPALNAGQIALAGAGGEISIQRLRDGKLLWTDSLASLAPLTPLQELGDILAHPVHDGQQIYVISQSGLFAAYGASSGIQTWAHPIAGVQMPWLAGDSLFVLSIDGHVISMGSETGEIKWVTPLAGSSAVLDASSPHAQNYFGPIVASGLVHVLSEYGVLISLNAHNGEIVREKKIGGRMITAPQIAHEMLVTLSASGRLTALR